MGLTASGVKKAALAALVAGGAYAGAPPKLLWSAGIHKRWPMEWFEVEASDGSTLSSEDCEDRPVLLVVWAAWCPFMPENLRVVERVKMRYRSTDVCIVPVSIDEKKEKAWEFARAQNLVEPYFWGYQGLSDMYWGTAVPHAFVFNRDGDLIFSGDTFAGEYDAVMEAMDKAVHDGGGSGSPSPTAPGHAPRRMPEVVEAEEIADRSLDLFKAGDADGLDALAREWRAGRARTAMDVWKEWILYNQIVLDSGASGAADADFKSRIAFFEKWAAARPQSTAARLALGRQWYQYAYRARGTDWASEVKGPAWKVFEERLATARPALEQAEAMPDKSPVVYYTLMGLARAQDRPESEREALFAKALKFEPDYIPYYFNRMTDFLPRWGGSAAKTLRFVEDASDGRGDGRGDELYARLVWELVDEYDEYENPFRHGYSWPRVLAGYRALIARDPGPAWRHQCARLAVLAGDRAVAREMFAAEGMRYTSWGWRDRRSFLDARRWARRRSVWQRLLAAVGLGGTA